MAGMGSGYDLSVNTFSPDGRVFQVEYAAKAVDNAGTTVGCILKDGVVFAVEKFRPTKMMMPSSLQRTFAVDEHAAIAVAGVVPDARQIVNRAREEAENYKRVYGGPIPGAVLNERLGLFIHAHTLGWSVRPFGTGLLLAVKDSDDAQLFSLDSAGNSYEYYGHAFGKGRQVAKTELEKLDLAEMTCDAFIPHAARILLLAHEDSKDKDMIMEIAYMGNLTNWRLEQVSSARMAEAVAEAEAAIEAMDEE